MLSDIGTWNPSDGMTWIAGTLYPTLSTGFKNGGIMMERPKKNCDRCGGEIGLFITHLMLTILMLDGKTKSQQRYCEDCCRDPSMAVLFNDVIENPVERILIAKVWG